MTREKFLRVCGSVLAGGSIAAVTTVLLHRKYATKDRQASLCKSRFPDCSGCMNDCPARR